MNRMKLAKLTLLLVLATASNADDSLQGPGAGGAADLLNQTKIDLGPPVAKPRLHVGVVCTDTSGAKYSPSDMGYETCMKSVNDTQVRGNSANPTNPQTAAGVSYKFGNQ